MFLLFYLAVFIIGCFIGSFLNVIVDRLPRSEGVITGRSHCESCTRKLPWHDLIPLLSFFFLGGKCRYCKARLSLYYPVIEGATGLLFSLTVFLIWQEWVPLSDTMHLYFLTTAYYLCIDALLILVFFTDLKYGIIPFRIVFWALGLTIFWYGFLTLFQHTLPVNFPVWIQESLVNYFLSAVGVFLFFLGLFFITRGKGLGFGDVVYVILMGLLLGFPKVILGLYIAFLSGALLALLLVLLQKKKFHGGTIPFGPFLVLGTIVSLYWGNTIIEKVVALL